MQTFFLAPVGSHAGLTSVALGIVRSFERVGVRAGFYKPVAQPVSFHFRQDASISFARELFHLDQPDPLSLNYIDNCLSRGETDQVMEEMIGNFQQIVHGVDIVVIEGLVPDSDRNFIGGMNAQIARNMNAKVIFVLNAASPEVIAEQLAVALQDFGGASVKIAGYVINKAPEGTDTRIFAQLVADAIQQPQIKKVPLLGVIPYKHSLKAPRTLDVARKLDAKVLNEGKIAEYRVNDFVIGAREVVNTVNRFKPGALIVTPGDRADMLLATALVATKGVPLAGLVLTCNAMPHENLQQLFSPTAHLNIPVLLSEHDTFETAQLLAEMDSHVPIDDLERMERVVDFIAEHLSVEELRKHITEPVELRMPPPAFRFRLLELARAANKRIVLPEGEEPRTIHAAAICQERGIANCILLGNPQKIREIARDQGITLPDAIQLVNPDDIRTRYVEPMVELRKNKGLTHQMAEQQLEDTVVLGTMMLAQNDVDGLVSGAVHTTASTVRPALQLIKTASNASLVSSIFFMLMPDQVLVYGDCAINPSPTVEQLADIAIQSADSAAAFGIDPRVAMISYSTGSSGSGSDVERVREATELVRTKRPDLVVDGPMQYDAASVESVGKQKAPNSTVAGQATVFIFPDLNTGNTTYKAVQRSANVVSVGPMLQGLRKPVNDLSRGALVDDIVYTIAITAIQVVQMEAVR